MRRPDSDTERFSLLVDALRPWLGKVVFIGGWAHHLYRERPEASSPSYEALRTEDADIALAAGVIAQSEDLGSLADFTQITKQNDRLGIRRRLTRPNKLLHFAPDTLPSPGQIVEILVACPLLFGLPASLSLGEARLFGHSS